VARKGNHFPPELLAMLDKGLRWMPKHYGEDFQVFDHLLPPTDEREPLYEAGYMKRPEAYEPLPPRPDRAQVERAQRIEAYAAENKLDTRAAEVAVAAQEKLEEIPATLSMLIEKIIAHAHRQELIQDPHRASLVYLDHLSSLSSWGATGHAGRYWFHTSPSAMELDLSEVTHVHHKDWVKAAASKSDTPEAIRDYKPAQAKLVLAWRLLSCLTLGYARSTPLTAEQIRAWFVPDERFLVKYRGAQLQAMLGRERYAQIVHRINPTKNNLAHEVAKMAKNDPTWLPMGFQAFLQAEPHPTEPDDAEDDTAGLAEVERQRGAEVVQSIADSLGEIPMGDEQEPDDPSNEEQNSEEIEATQPAIAAE
jgi:hypothetical protein